MSSRLRLGLALLASSFISVGLYAAGWIANGEAAYIFFLWNLGLAWIPLVLALWLERTLRTRLWSSWLALVITALWLVFLPNSFYMITDFMHLGTVPRVDPLLDVVMFTSFIINSLIVGYLSVFIVHQELLKRLSKRRSFVLISGVFLLISFAMYIGRDLRWNTWDALFNAFSLMFDISDRLLNPGTHPQLFSATLSLFAVLTSIYVVIWMLVRASRTVKQ